MPAVTERLKLLDLQHKVQLQGTFIAQFMPQSSEQELRNVQHFEIRQHESSKLIYTCVMTEMPQFFKIDCDSATQGYCG